MSVVEDIPCVESKCDTYKDRHFRNIKLDTQHPPERGVIMNQNNNNHEEHGADHP